MKRLPIDNAYLVEGQGKEGFFEIISGSTNVHPFEMKGDPIEIAAVHTLNRQDLSLRAWISNKPVEPGFNTLLETERYVNIPRRIYIWTVYEQGSPQPMNESIQYIPLPLGQYYFNVKNLENAMNGYRLFFSNVNAPKDKIC